MTLAKLRNDEDLLFEYIIEISDKLNTLMEEWHEMRELINKINGAFPDKDPDAHRMWHEIENERIKAIRRLTATIKEKTIAGLVWSGIVALCGLLWTGIKAKLAM
jgi:hypothetical protein